jgi:hypothetical protein
MQKMSGGCLCGHIRYSAEAEPIMTAICHCNDCQRQTGSAFAVVVDVPRPVLKMQGQPRIFKGHGASGKPVYRHFCADCGSPLFVEIDVMPDVAFIRAGTLDDRTWLHPTVEVWCETAQPWTQQHLDMQRFQRMPE